MKTPEQWTELFVSQNPDKRTYDDLVEFFSQAQQEARQAQHKVTWAMAMEAAASFYSQHTVSNASEVIPLDRDPCFETHPVKVFKDAIRALPCPPLDGDK